jgi:hypothetical protein
MPVTINASPTNGLVQTADGSGIIRLQSNGVTTNALAWVNFNGTGTVAIRSSYNVSSITDNGTGDYTVNFTTALADANYAAVGSAGDPSTNGNRTILAAFYSAATASVRVTTVIANTATSYDTSTISAAIFGN